MGFLRPKGNLSRSDRWILGILVLAPLASMGLRILALPGIMGPGLGGLGVVGNALNNLLSLNAIPVDQRDHVLYLLFIPVCALLVTFTRLTLGIAVLGFRSILISVGFRASGIVPSLLLIAISVTTIVLVRPWLKRLKLPYFGRIPVILSIVSLTMIGPLLAGPWVWPGVLWGAATFPVIVLGMLSEGIASTLDHDNAIVASWRAITTLLLGFVCALLCWWPAFQSLMLTFPELVLAQIAGIILVSEYLDLRLFKDLDKQVARRILGRPRAIPSGPRVAVVRNRLGKGRAARAGHGLALRSVQKVADALRSGGYTVKVLEGDARLPAALRKFLRPDKTAAKGQAMVFNLAHGLRGDAPATQVPALLEMSGIPYVGPTPLGHAMASDRLMARTLLRRASIPTPAFRVMSSAGEAPGRLHFPLVVWPRLRPGGKGKRVADRHQLRNAVERVLRRHEQEALVEERIRGMRVSAGLVGNDPVECLPLVEMDTKNHAKICPARLDDHLAERVRECARAAFQACGCRDYARVDLCVTESGEVWVLEVRTLGILAHNGAFARAGLEAGYPYDKLVCRILEVASARAGARKRSAGERKSSRKALTDSDGAMAERPDVLASLEAVGRRADLEPAPTTSAVS